MEKNYDTLKNLNCLCACKFKIFDFAETFVDAKNESLSLQAGIQLFTEY